jgi:hypothetical protein
MQIRRLTPTDAAQFYTLRLDALREAPTAFGSSYEEEKDIVLTTIEARLPTRPDREALGAFEGDHLVGLVALERENMHGLAHFVPAIGLVNLSVNGANLAAIGLYESVGFKTFGREPGAMCINGMLHVELHMQLRLQDAAFQP